MRKRLQRIRIPETEAARLETRCRTRRGPALSGFVRQSVGPLFCSPGTMSLEIKLRASHDLLSGETAQESYGWEGACLKHGVAPPDSPVLTDILLTLRQRPEDAGWPDWPCLPGRRQGDKKWEEAAAETADEGSGQTRCESRERDEQRRR